MSKKIRGDEEREGEREGGGEEGEEGTRVEGGT